MMNNYSQNRWVIIAGAIMCQFCAGMLYSWSVFQKPIVKMFGWETGQVSLAFSISTFMLPVAMIVAGVLLPIWGPRKVASLGGFVLAIGLLTASRATSLPMLYIGYGFLGGSGVGLIYGVPISTCSGWFTDRTGMITGLAVAGFGFGSCVYAPIASHIVERIGPMSAFQIQAVITLIGVTLGSTLLKAPPKADPQIGADGSAQQASHDFTPGGMLHSRQYWLLLVMYIIANATGLMVVGHASPIGQQLAGITPVQAGAVVSILAVANTMGRLLGGALSDRFGSLKVVIGLYLINTAAMFSLKLMTNFTLFGVTVAVLACSFGGMVGTYPSIVLYSFGRKFYSVNYGLVFIAYGIGGIIGPQIASHVLRFQSNYTLAFIIVGTMNLAGVAMAFLCCKGNIAKEGKNKDTAGCQNEKRRQEQPD